jgi:hypothetical protein
MSSTPPQDPHADAARLGAAVTEFAALGREIAELVSAGVTSTLPIAAVPDLAVSLHRGIDAATAAATVVTGVVDRSGVVLGAGHSTTRAWLTGACGLSGDEATVVLARSRSFERHFPATRAAWLAQEITTAVMKEITVGLPKALRRLSVAERDRVMPVAEAVTLEFAREHPVGDLRWFIAMLRQNFDVDGANAGAMAAYEDQYLRLTPDADGVQLRGFLTAETAAAVLAVLDQVVDGWYRSGSLAPQDQPAEGEGALLGTRRRRVRRDHLNALAFEHIVTGLLGDGLLGTKHEVRPHITATIHADDLAAGLGAELNLPGHSTRVLLPDASLRRLLCDCAITPVFTARPDTARTTWADGLGLDGSTSGDAVIDIAVLEAALRRRAREVLDVGRTVRTATAKQRRALEVRDRHCGFPGCRIDPTRCEAHHVTHWEHGGSTAIDNLVLLCRGHHRSVHEGGWTVSPREEHHPGHPDHWAFAPPPRR